MTLVHSVNGTPLPSGAVLLGTVTGYPSSAWYGEPMTAGLQIDDPEGAYDLQGWSVFTVDETDCVGKERIFTGWISGKKISRGGKYKDGDARVWDCDIIDQNAALGLQIFRANSAKRPAETDLERVDFILSSAPMHYTPVAEGTLTNLSANPANLQEADHTRQYPVEALTSTAGRSGKWFYVFWNDDTAQLELFYDLPSAFPVADIAISNVIADVDDDTIFFPNLDATLDRSPANVYTGELLDYVGGAVFVERQATIDALSPTPLSPDEFRRDFHRSSDQIGRADTATTLATADLEAFATEEDTIRCIIRVPSTHVNFVKAGQVMPAKFTHFPGYELAPDIRVVRRNVVPTTTSAGRFYDISLELTNKVKIRDLDGGPPGVFPKQPCLPTLVQFVEKFETEVLDPPVLAHIPTPGNLLVAWGVIRGTPGDELNPDGFTGLGADWVSDPATGGGHKSLLCRLWYRIVQIGDDNHITMTAAGSPDHTFYVVMEFSGATQLDDYVEQLDDTDQSGAPDPYFFSSGPTTPLVGRPVLMVSGVMPSLNVNDDWNPAETTGGIQVGASGVGTSVTGQAPKSWVGYKAGPDAFGVAESFVVSDSPSGGIARGWAGLQVMFSDDPCDDDCPQAGQWVRGEFVASGDGTTTTFFTKCPYADNSLNVRVDGVPLLIGVTESNPATGEFQLDFAPKDVEGDAPAEQVFASYQGR